MTQWHTSIQQHARMSYAVSLDRRQQLVEAKPIVWSGTDRLN
jgi:hypothetical protein